MKAWLITWEHIGDHVKPSKRIVALLSPRWSPVRVRDHVHVLYSMEGYSPAEKLGLLKRRSQIPYPADFQETQGRITCGHNPWLYARLVDDLRVSTEATAIDGLTWTERPLPNRRRP